VVTWFPAAHERLGVRSQPALAAAPEENTNTQRVYVIGYPLGGGLSISLRDSTWLDTDGKMLHYRTPTEQGSSGSPVFDQNYRSVLALHHKGKSDLPCLNGLSGTYEANEGVAITAIREAVRQSSEGTSRR
jgi:V8-like Glu-specific endopeptidase